MRTDTALRRIRDARRFRDNLRERLGGGVACASYAVGTLLGGRGLMEIGGVAVNPGSVKETAWLAEDPTWAQAVRANGLVFASGASGLADARTGALMQKLYGDQRGQTRQALRRLEAALNRFDSTLDDVLRLDVFLDDIYYEDEFIEAAREFFGNDPAGHEHRRRGPRTKRGSRALRHRGGVAFRGGQSNDDRGCTTSCVWRQCRGYRR